MVHPSLRIPFKAAGDLDESRETWLAPTRAANCHFAVLDDTWCPLESSWAAAVSWPEC